MICANDHALLNGRDHHMVRIGLEDLVRPGRWPSWPAPGPAVPTYELGFRTKRPTASESDTRDVLM